MFLDEYNQNIAMQKLNQKPKTTAKRVEYITTGQIFNSLTEAQSWCQLKSKSGLTLACQDKRNFAGKHPTTNQPLQWQYVD